MERNAPSPNEPTPADESAPRRLLWWLGGSFIGIAIALQIDATLGGVVTVGGLLGALWQLHRLGRAGPVG